MCLAIPGRVIAVREEDGAAVADVEYGGVRRRALLLYLPETRVGDWVVVQAGFAIRRLTAEEAHAALEVAEAGAPLLRAEPNPVPTAGHAPARGEFTERL
ncbi:MAG TPA: HypC/HybG/HupF family hydrogenase formation chaperone [Thermoplasmata archaeon]|nr:HypC/HybG/HupF family hydrogenase formation chaperone [Thermoplasmata archaeon]